MIPDIKPFLPLIKNRCFYFCKNKDSGELLFSDVLEKIWKGKDKFQGESEDFRKWVYSIIRNAYINHYRQDQKATFYDIDNFYNIEDKSISLLENKEFIEACIKRIDFVFKNKPQYIHVFRYCLVGGNTYKDSSEFLNIPMGTLKAMIFQIRKELSYLRDSQ
jgi:RNA polymerase sigma-70 factor (ECF subfamily)